MYIYIYIYVDKDIHTYIHHLYYRDKAPAFRGATAALKASLTKLMKRVTEASSRVEKAGTAESVVKSVVK